MRVRWFLLENDLQKQNVSLEEMNFLALRLNVFQTFNFRIVNYNKTVSKFSKKIPVTISFITL
jgi:hypothetical protein